MRLKTFFASSIALSLAAMLTACGGTALKGISDAKQELTVNLIKEVDTLDWQAVSSENEIQIYNWVMEGLTRSAGKGKVKPGIADKWEVSPDGKTWTFHLRHAKWSDEKPVTANDFAYGAMRALSPKDPKKRAYLLFDIAGAEEYASGKGDASKVGIRAIDDTTIEFRLRQPVTYFDYLVSLPVFAPVREDVYERLGKDYNNASPEYFVTDGPFEIAEWTKREKMVFEKSRSYWDNGSIRLEKVTGLMVDNEADELGMYLSGKLDHTIQVNSDQKAQIENAQKGEIGNYPDGTVWFFNYNMKDPVLGNKDIRKALTYAIDRARFIKDVSKYPWKPAAALVQPDVIPNADGTGAFRERVPAYFKDNDVEGARAHLKAGLKALGMSRLPSLELLVNDTDEYKRYAQAYQRMWKDNLGIDVVIKPVPSKDRISRQHNHDYQISLGGWGADFPDPMTDLDLYVTGAGNNTPAYSNPEYDKLIKAAKAEPDKGRKYELMYAAERMLMEDMPIGPLYCRYRDYAVREYVKGLRRDAFAPDIDFIYAYIDGKK